MGDDILVLDLETQKSFKDVGRSRLEKLKISVVGVYDYHDDSSKCYEEKEVMAFEKRLRTAGLVIGFNIRRFDFPVLDPYIFMSAEEIPCLDLLDDIEKNRGHRASLDSIAGPTLKQHKIGNGADALVLYKEGRMEELKRYCLEDVRLTKEVYEFGCEHGHVLFTSNWDYKTYEIPVSWKQTTSEFLKKEESQPQSSFPSSLF